MQPREPTNSGTCFVCGIQPLRFCLGVSGTDFVAFCLCGQRSVKPTAAPPCISYFCTIILQYTKIARKNRRHCCVSYQHKTGTLHRFRHGGRCTEDGTDRQQNLFMQKRISGAKLPHAEGVEEDAQEGAERGAATTQHPRTMHSVCQPQHTRERYKDTKLLRYYIVTCNNCRPCTGVFVVPFLCFILSYFHTIILSAQPNLRGKKPNLRGKKPNLWGKIILGVEVAAQPQRTEQQRITSISQAGICCVVKPYKCL